MYYGTTALALINIRRLRRIAPESLLNEYGDVMFPRLRAFLMHGTHGTQS